jgi:hypothetical protein
MALRPAVIGVVVLLAGFGLILATPLIYEQLIARGSSMRWVPRIAHMIGALPPELTSAIDLSAYLLLLAVVTRVYRAGLARWHDRAIRCRRCGHDLRGTPTMDGSDGIGRCGECGTLFVRAVGSQPRRRRDAQGEGELENGRRITGEMKASHEPGVKTRGHGESAIESAHQS